MNADNKNTMIEQLREQLTSPMKFDLLGEIKTTKVQLQNSFMPLFEAVVNSIHSTEDRFGDEVPKKGLIDVIINRVPQMVMEGIQGRHPIEPIQSFQVVDNGIGFNDENIEAFRTASTTAKASRGGRGKGRFSWLVVFQYARIESTFIDDGQSVRWRQFFFRPSPNGIEEFTEGQSSNNNDLRTTVTLHGVNDRYFEPLRKGVEVIAEKLFEHCFNYLSLGRCPRIVLRDDSPNENSIIELNDMMEAITTEEPIELDVNGHTLNLRHVQLDFTANRRHEVHLCAHNRVVTSYSLSQYSNIGPEPLLINDSKRIFQHVFVTGEALDSSVDTTRTRLDLPDDDPLLEYGGELDLKTLRRNIGEHIDIHFGHIIDAARKDTFKKVEFHIRTVQPEYRHLLSRLPNALESVKWTDNRAELDEQLYRVQQEWETSVRRHQAEVEQKLVSKNADPDHLAEEIAKVIAEVNDSGQSNLVRYVAKRRAVLKLIEHLTSAKLGPGLEEHVHRIVFPIRSTADDISFEDHNLWLVDDALSFYEYVASDISFSSNKASPTESIRRPDILAFKTGDPFQHIAIVEFKRPDRDDEDPVKQLVEYALLLRDGGRRDAKGRTLPGVAKSIRIDAYAIATLTPKLEKLMRSAPGNMSRVESEWRWYGGIPDENITIELLDYRAFVTRAQQRNHPFFTKLGLA